MINEKKYASYKIIVCFVIIIRSKVQDSCLFCFGIIIRSRYFANVIAIRLEEKFYEREKATDKLDKRKAEMGVDVE